MKDKVSAHELGRRHAFQRLNDQRGAVFVAGRAAPEKFTAFEAIGVGPLRAIFGFETQAPFVEERAWRAVPQRNSRTDIVQDASAFEQRAECVADHSL